MFKFKRSYKVQRLAMIALMSALAYLLHFFQVRAFSFLTYEPKNFIVALTAMTMGPLESILVSFNAAFFEMITTSDTGFYGFLMNFIAGMFFAIPVGLIYKINKNKLSLLFGLIIGSLSLIASMTLLNIIITPIYLGTTTSAVIELLPIAVVPFNALKGLIDSLLIMSLAPGIMTNLRSLGFSGNKKKYDYISIPKKILYIVISILMLCLAITLLVLMYTNVIGMK